MTIRKRLGFSNVLMIVIPVLLSITMMVLYVGFVWTTYFQGTNLTEEGSQHEQERMAELMGQVGAILSMEDAARRVDALAGLETTLFNEHLSLEIIEQGPQYYQLGEPPSYGQILTTTFSEGGRGVTVELAATIQMADDKITVGDSVYYLRLARMQTADERTANTVLSWISAFMPILILLTVVLTNRFLIRFVFRKIEGPLLVLADGVHQIRDGNLDYRIHYEGRDEFGPICEDFNDMAVQLQSSVALIRKQDKSRKELLAGISHDLRSPLTSIRAYAEGLLDGVASTPEAQWNYVRMIKTKAEEIDDMVSKIFLFSKMDLGDYPYAPELLELDVEVRSLVEAIEEEYQRQGLEIRMKEPLARMLIHVDPVQLRSILSNLMENSLKHGGKDATAITIHAKRRAGYAVLTVEDDGQGVPEEALLKIFEVFYRSDPARNQPQKGSGLGLAVAAKAVERMGGAITAENVHPHGLRMILRIPLEED